LFKVICHSPPAFSQSACVVNFPKSSPVAGLAEGDGVDAPPAPVPVVAPPDDVPDVPEPEPEPDAPGLLEPAPLAEPPLPPLPPAAAMAGASAMMPTRKLKMTFCM
jgi:hypothetical protein